MNEIVKERFMTVKEVANALNVSERTVQSHAKNMGLTQNGIETRIDELQVTEIKKRIAKSGRFDLANVCEVENAITEIEEHEIVLKAMLILNRKIEEYKKRTDEAERKNAVLMHVKKTYTATEIAKELGLRSAIELNEKLEQRKVQYKMNDTWVPTADYSECGYFHIKQEVLDTGKVIYHRRITQLGRDFILGLFVKEACEVE